MTLRPLLAALLPALLAPAAAAVGPPPGDVTVRTTLALKKPRSRPPVLGGSRERVYFQAWLPAGVNAVRGAVCNPFSRDEPVSKHWKAACRHWRFAYVQTDFDGVRKEEFGLLGEALARLAKASGHPELAHAPLCFLGMSRGGGISMHLAERMPGRTIASAPVCLEVGPTSKATRAVPVLTVFGERDGRQMGRLLEKLPAARKEEARWAIAVQWGRRHEFALANNLVFVFFDEAIRLRLPAKAGAGPVSLKDVPLKDGWLGDIGTWGKDGRLATVAPWKGFKGDRGRACWFPSERAARVWQAFVSASKDVTLDPPGLGDRQPFTLHPSGKALTVKVALPRGAKPGEVELWDGGRRLARRAAAPWAFEVPLRPGVHSLYAAVQEEGRSVKLSRPHTIVVGE